MAVTLKKRKKKGMLLPHELNIDAIINDCIRSIIMSCLSLPRENMIKWTEYFPTYMLCDDTQKQVLSSVHIKLRYNKKYTRIGADEMIIAGVNPSEFISFLENKGVKRAIDMLDNLSMV